MEVSGLPFLERRGIHDQAFVSSVNLPRNSIALAKSAGQTAGSSRLGGWTSLFVVDLVSLAHAVYRIAAARVYDSNDTHVRQ